MKKLKLKLDSVKETLSKEQMKKISGGYSGNHSGGGGPTCPTFCSSDIYGPGYCMELEVGGPCVCIVAGNLGWGYC
jgi:bacteriocin-like protein